MKAHRAVLLSGGLYGAMLLGGCTSLPTVHVEEPPLPPQDKLSFVDQRMATDQHSFMFGAGNIYSCHYAIDRQKDDVLDPDGMTLLHAYLSSKVFTDGQPHTVTVTRLEIYVNRQVPVKYAFLGGIYAPPPLVGCEGAGQGEYLLREMPPTVQAAPIIIYLDATVDGQEHKVRILQPSIAGSDSKIAAEDWPGALTAAVYKTFAALGEEIKGH